MHIQRDPPAFSFILPLTISIFGSLTLLKEIISLGEPDIFFNVADINKQTVLEVFQDENSDLNPYYPRFKSHQLEIEETELNFKVYFSLNDKFPYF